MRLSLTETIWNPFFCLCVASLRNVPFIICLYFVLFFCLCLLVDVSVIPPIYMCVCLTMSPYFCLFVFLFISPSVCLSLLLFLSQSASLLFSFSLSLPLSYSLSLLVCLFLLLFLYQPVSLSNSFSLLVCLSLDSFDSYNVQGIANAYFVSLERNMLPSILTKHLFKFSILGVLFSICFNIIVLMPHSIFLTDYAQFKTSPRCPLIQDISSAYMPFMPQLQSCPDGNHIQ